MCKAFGFFGNFLSFINIVFNIAVSFEGCSGIEGDVFSLIKNSVGITQKRKKEHQSSWYSNEEHFTYNKYGFQITMANIIIIIPNDSELSTYYIML